MTEPKARDPIAEWEKSTATRQDRRRVHRLAIERVGEELTATAGKLRRLLEAEHESDADDALGELERLQSVREALEGSFEQSRQASAREQQTAGRLQQAETALDAAVAEVTAFRDALAGAQDALRASKQARNDAEGRADCLAREVQEARATTSAQAAQLTEALNDLTVAGLRHVELTEQLAQARAALDELARERGAIAKRALDAESIANGLGLELARAQEAERDARSNLAAGRAQAAHDLDALREAMAQAAQKASETEKRSHAALRDTRDIIEGLEREHEEQQQALEAALAELKDTRARASELQAELDRIGERCVEAEQRASEAQERARAQDAELERLRNETVQRADALRKLRDQYESEHVRAERLTSWGEELERKLQSTAAEAQERARAQDAELERLRNETGQRADELRQLRDKCELEHVGADRLTTLREELEHKLQRSAAQAEEAMLELARLREALRTAEAAQAHPTAPSTPPQKKPDRSIPASRRSKAPRAERAKSASPRSRATTQQDWSAGSYSMTSVEIRDEIGEDSNPAQPPRKKKR